MKPKISVIIPVYNVEDFLEDTLNCLLNQTLIDEMEVLMIDDGSTDNSRYIIEKYDLDYENFHAYHKTNEGSSYTRNYGIELAKGEYIHFLDGDDLIEPGSYERLYKIARENNSDIVTAPIVRFKRYNLLEGIFYKNSFKNINEDRYSTKFEDNPELIWDLFITNKLYKREFLNKHDLRLFEMDRSYCDDVPFSLKSYLLAKNISISSKIFYYWRIRENKHRSITQNITNNKNFFDRLMSINLCNEIFGMKDVKSSFKDLFYVKLLNYDLFVHLIRFHMYDEKYYHNFIEESNKILDFIPDRCIDQLNSFNKVLYELVENSDIENLCEFSKLSSKLNDNPKVFNDFENRYSKHLDFEKDALNEELYVKKENAYIDGDNLIVEYIEKIKFLSDDYPHESKAYLIDNENNQYPLEIAEDKIIIPIELLYNKNHMTVKVEYITDDFVKEGFLISSKRDVLNLDDCDIELDIGVFRKFYIDIRSKNDLEINVDEVFLDEDVFEFKGHSSERLNDVFMQNLVTFNKIFYPVKSYKHGNGYKFSFSIPLKDIISFTIRKWELKFEDSFKSLNLSRKFEFFMPYNHIYMMNVRNKILISEDVFDSLDTLDVYYNKINDLRQSSKDLKISNKELKRTNKNLKKTNDVLKKENEKLSKELEYFENKIFNFNAIKNKFK